MRKHAGRDMSLHMVSNSATEKTRCAYLRRQGCPDNQSLNDLKQYYPLSAKGNVIVLQCSASACSYGGIH